MIWVSRKGSRRTNWNWPSQAKNRPSAIPPWLIVAPSASIPIEKRERTATTCTSVRDTHSWARRIAVTVDSPLRAPGESVNGLPSKDV